MNSTQPITQRRRSERVSKSLPVVVRGIDLLGQPFEERTSTLSFNLHGCRYSSKHHLPKNTWITLEVPQNSGGRTVRARVAWIQRPHSTREFFQIAVELESPANIWEVDSWPSGETMASVSHEASAGPYEDPQSNREEGFPGIRTNAFRDATFTSRETTEKAMTDSVDTTPEATFVSPLAFSSALAESPLLRELSAELRRQAKEAIEAETSRTNEKILASSAEIERKSEETERLFENWKEQFEKAQADARAELAVHLAAEREALRAARMAAQPSEEKLEAAENETARWRERIAAEMSIAQTQWNELLQSSLDSNMQRLAAQLSAQSQSMLRGAEEKIAERVAELRQPLAQMSADAREAVSSVKAVLEEEVSRARGSLAEIEQSASRMKEYSAQLEAANHDTLNELHRRLESILETQTEEMHRRAERLAAGMPGRVMPPLESLTHQLIERSLADVESKLRPHFERVPELLRELGAREMQVEEGLRLHRERLRQLSENNQREVSSQLAGTIAGLNNDFEAARREALAKWTEELDAGGVRASHAVSEAIGRASEWFQQEASARLQVLVEQSLVAAGAGFDEKTGEAAQKFAADLDGQTTARLGQVREQLNDMAGEVTGHARTQLTEAAEIAAASFGQVLHGISAQETEQFTATSRDSLHAHTRELEGIAEKLVRNADAAAGESIERFHAQMASHLEASISEGRTALSSEFQSVLDGYRSERDAHQKDWAESLDRLTGEAAQRYQERLDSTCDAWMVASVRRLNEHGQNVVESLMRSADQSLRDSCSRVFEGLSAMLRGQTANPAGFAAPPSHETPDAPRASQ